MPRLCTSRHPTHQAGRLAAVRTARRCVGVCVGPRCMRRACWAGLASGRLRLGHGAHLARHARKTGGLDAVVPGSPRPSSFSCEACGALRRAAVESLICQLLYNYSSVRVSSRDVACHAYCGGLCMHACAYPSAKKSDRARLRAPPTRVHHGSPPASQQAGLLLAGRGPAPSWRRRPCGVVSGKRTDPMSGVKRSAALRAREGGSGNYWFVTLLLPAYRHTDLAACLRPLMSPEGRGLSDKDSG